MKALLIPLLFAGLLGSKDVQAADYGRWYCDTCIFDAGAGAAQDLGEVYVFLRSNKITDRWAPYDTITVCDGSLCLVVTWVGTTWQPAGPPFRDARGGYKNAPAASFIYGQGCVGYTGSTSVIPSGRWEWWDHYSNGEYIGSSQLQFVFTSFSVYGGGGMGYACDRIP